MFSNMTTKYEVNVFNFSVAMANNKLSVSDLTSGDNIEDKLFEGNDPVNLRLDTQFFGPSFAFKKGKWGFGLNSSAYLKANVVRFLRQTQFILFSYIEVDRLTLLVQLNKGGKVFFERFVFYNYYYFLHKLHLSIHDRFLVFMFD